MPLRELFVKAENLGLYLLGIPYKTKNSLIRSVCVILQLNKHLRVFKTYENLLMAAKQLNRTYVRDARSPIPMNEVVSKTMSANKCKDTKPELLLRKELWYKGLKGYRLHWKKIPGRPDISYPGKRIAIFVNGCFWHRCPFCNLHVPKNNKEFWAAKFERNVERDKLKVDELKRGGWKVLVFWECQIKKNVDEIINTIREELRFVQGI